MREDDVALLHRFAESRAQDAFTELVRRNMDAVYSAALRQVGGDTHLAKDVAQQVFVTLACRASSLTQHPVLAGWLFTATRNAAINMVRTERRRRIREQEAHAMNENLSDQTSDAVWSKVAPILDDVIDRLNENDRMAVLLRFFEQRTFVEMGAALCLTEDAARMRVDRALEKLRVLLARRGISSTAALLGTTLAHYTVAAAPAGFALATAGSTISGVSGGGQVFFTGSLERFGGLASSAILIAVIVTVIYGHLENRHAASALLAEQQALSAIESRLGDLEPQSHAAVSGTGNNSVSRQDLDRFAAANGTVLEKRGGGQRLELSATYHSLYRSLQLTPEQIEQFESVSVRRPGAVAWMFELDPLESTGVPPAFPILPDAVVEAELRAVLGARGYETYKEYTRTLPARTLTRQLASTIYLTDPLSAAQGEQLTLIMGAASASYQAGGTIDRSTLDWDTVLAQAKSVLSPPQLAALGGAVRQKEAFHQALLRRLKPAPTFADGAIP